MYPSTATSVIATGSTQYCIAIRFVNSFRVLKSKIGARIFIRASVSAFEENLTFVNNRFTLISLFHLFFQIIVVEPPIHIFGRVGRKQIGEVPCPTGYRIQADVIFDPPF